MSERRDDPIDLALAEDFRLGVLEVCPSLRQVRRGDLRETLEPRVMQVLVALAGAGGAVVSRDELIARCWEGRVVGEDAINRAIGRLRRLSEADDGGSFLIDTIPRVGYRLTVGATGPAPLLNPPTMRDRRWLVGAGGALLAAAGAGAYALRSTVEPPPSRLALQLEEGKQSIRRGDPGSAATAAGVFEQVTRVDPGSAEAWGGMALAYSYATHGVPERADAFLLRAEDAIRHARAINPRNAYAFAAEATLLPIRGAWAKREAIYREGLKYNSASDELLLELADMLNNTGRNSEAADFAARANAAANQPDPALTWLSTQIYWCAGRLAEADAVATQGAALFPRQRSCWFSRIYFLMHTGRTDEALAIISDQNSKPPGTAEEDFEAVASVARALKSRAKADIDAAMVQNLALARRGAGYAENAIAHAAAMRRVDDAFLIAEGLYFGRGFEVGSLRFSDVQRAFTLMQDRRTRALFYPSGRAMQRDPRFAALMDEIGLTRYWKDAGVTPDYQRG